MFKTLLILITSLFLFTGCSTWSTANIKPSGQQNLPKKIKNTNEIVLTEENITDRKYISLGEIDVSVNKLTVFHSDPKKEDVNKKLKEEASKLGADAVIFVRYGTVGMTMWSYGSLNGKGRAVKFVE